MKIGIKKLISWVLCLIMLLSMMPLNVIAEEGDNGTDTGTVETNPPVPGENEGEDLQGNGNADSGDDQTPPSNPTADNNDTDGNTPSTTDPNGDNGDNTGDTTNPNGDNGDNTGNITDPNGDNGDNTGNTTDPNGDSGDNIGNTTDPNGENGNNTGNTTDPNGDNGENGNGEDPVIPGGTEPGEDGGENEPAQNITLTGEYNGVTVTIENVPAGTELTLKGASGYEEALKEKAEEYAVLFGLDIGLNVELESKVKVTLKGEVFAELDPEAELYHINDKNEAEKISFGYDDKEQKIEFSAKEFSPYVLIKTETAENTDPDEPVVGGGEDPVVGGEDPNGDGTGTNDGTGTIDGVGISDGIGTIDGTAGINGVGTTDGADSDNIDTSEKVGVSVKAEFPDEQNSENLPSSLKVSLVLGDETIAEAELNGENEWKYTWEGLETAEYTVKAADLDGYCIELKGSMEEGFVFTCTKKTPAKESTREIGTEYYNGGVQRKHSGEGTTENDLSFEWSITWNNVANDTTVEYWRPEGEGSPERLLFHPADWDYVGAGVLLNFKVNRLSGAAEDASIPAGAIKLVLPKTVFYGWNGEEVGYFDTKIKEQAGEGTYFVRSTDADGNIVITNVLPFFGGRGYEALLTYKVDPTNINGGHPSDLSEDQTQTASRWWIGKNSGVNCYTDYYSHDMDFTFTVAEHPDQNPNMIATGKLGVDVMTRAVSYGFARVMPIGTGVAYNYTNSSGQVASSYSQGVFLAWQSAWGEAPGDANDYFYVVFNVNYARGKKSEIQVATQPWMADICYDTSRNANHVWIKGHDYGPGEVVGTLQSGHVKQGVPWYGDDVYYYTNITDNTALTGISNGITHRTTRSVHKKGYISEGGAYCNPANRPSLYSNGTHVAFLIKYPWSLFQSAINEGLDFNEEAIEINAEFTIYETWDSGYKREMIKPAGPVRVSMEPRGAGGTFTKQRTPYNFPTLAGFQTFLLNGNELELIQTETSWTISFDGRSASENGVPLGQKIEILEPRDSNLLLSGSGTSGYNGWSPSDQVAVDENNYALTRFYVSALTQYDGQNTNGIWTINAEADTNYTSWSAAILQTRARNSTEWVDYVTIARTGASSWKVKLMDGTTTPGGNATRGYLLPENTVQIRLKYESTYSRTAISLRVTAKLLNTETVIGILHTHEGKGWDTYVKDYASYSVTPLQTPQTAGLGTYGGTNLNGTGSNRADHNYFILTKSNPSLSLTKSYYIPPIADARQQAANEKGKQIAYVGLHAASYAGMLTKTANEHDDWVTPYKPLKGTFYELLPPGTSFDPNSFVGFYDLYHQNDSDHQRIRPEKYDQFLNESSTYASSNRRKMKKGSEFQVDTYTDPATGQTMVVINYDVTTTAFDKRSATTEWTARVVFLFIMEYSYDNMAMYGTETMNALGYVNLTEGALTPVSSTLEKAALGNLEAAFTEINNNNTYAAFTKRNMVWPEQEVIEYGCDKTVSVEESLNGVPVLSSFQQHAVATIGNTYTYCLRYATGSETKADNIIFYDVLESGTSSLSTAWKGTFVSVNVEKLKERVNENDSSAFCNPKVYYSTEITEKNSQSGSYFNLQDSRWSTALPSDPSKVTAIAIDCSEDDKGNPFVMGEKETIYAYITMLAPDEFKPNNAVNGLVLSCKPFSADFATSGADTPTKTFLVDAEVELRDVIVGITKTSDPETGTSAKRRLVAAEGTGTIDYTVTVRSSGEYDYREVIVTDPIPKGLTVTEIKVGLNGAALKPIGSVTGVSYTQNGQLLTFTIDKQYPTVTDNEGNVTSNKDTVFLIKTTVDKLVDAEGNQIFYRNYDNTATLEYANGIKINKKTDTMYHRAESVQVTVKKIWDDGDDRDRKRPASIEFTLSASYIPNGATDPVSIDLGSSAKVTVSPDADGNWPDPAYTWENLEKYADFANRVLIDYAVTEAEVTYYTTECDPEPPAVPELKDGVYEFTFTNKYTPETVERTIKKIWDDADDQDGIRPKSIEVLLIGDDGNIYRVKLDGTVDSEPTGTAPAGYESEAWVATFVNLPKNKAGVEIVYGYAETETSVITKDTDGPGTYAFKWDDNTVTNKHTPELVTIEVEKVWKDSDDRDKIRPKSVTIKLLKDGTEIDSLELNESNNWKGSFPDLDKYENGKEITYTIDEVKVPQYKVKIDGPSGTTTKRYVITNTYNPPDQPPTGDNSNLWLWVMLLGVSTVAIVGLAVVLTKKKRKEK